MDCNNNNNNNSININANNNNIDYNYQQRRRSSIFPLYLRQQNKRKDSTFASQSTTNLYPSVDEELQPGLILNKDNNNNNKRSNLKFGWINGVYVI